MNKVAVYRKEHFNAAHRLNNPQFSEEKNKAYLANVITQIIMGIIMN